MDNFNNNNNLQTIHEEKQNHHNHNHNNKVKFNLNDDDNDKDKLDLGKQFSRAGIQSNLIFFTKKFTTNHKIVPKRHFTSPQDKQRRLQNLPQKINENKIPSAVFKSIDRETLFQRSSEKSYKIYEPKYHVVRPNPVSYTIPPHQQTYPRQRVFSPPECILRGNTCDQEIRKLIIKMKKVTEKIQKLQQELHNIEFKTLNNQGDDIHDIGQKKKKLEDGLLNERRKIAEEILEQEKIFQQDRNTYNELIEQNLDLLEIKELNLIPEKLQSHISAIDYDRIPGRGQLFQPPDVHDLSEKQFNNFHDFQAKTKVLETFEYQKPRQPLFPQNDNVDFYNEQQNQYFKNKFSKTPYQCLVNLKNQSAKQISQKQKQEKKDKGVKILEVTKNIHRPLDIKGYVETSKQIDREIPNSNQMRVIPAQMNCFKRWKSNSPLKYQQQLEQQKQEEQQQRENQNQLNKLKRNKNFQNSDSMSPGKFNNMKLQKISDTIEQSQQLHATLDLQQSSKPIENTQTQNYDHSQSLSHKQQQMSSDQNQYYNQSQTQSYQ